MKKVNPALEQAFDTTSRRLRDADRLIIERAEVLMRDYSGRRGRDWYISRKAFMSGNLAVAEEIFRPFGLNVSQVKNLLEGILENKGTQRYFSKTHIVNADRKHVIISIREDESTHQEILIEETDHVVSHSLGTFRLHKTRFTGEYHTQPYAITIDYDLLSFPLKIRKWAEGDTFQPLGMTGKKKVSDFMIDAKIPLNLKQRVCVLESEGKIVWVIGYRLDERFKVTEGTSSVLHISLEHDQSI